MPSASLRSPFLRPGAFWLAGLVVLALPAVRCAAQDDNPPSLSDAVSEKFEDLKPLVDAKQWDAALELLNSMLPLAKPNSYDLAEIMNMKAKLFMEKDDMADAIEPWETVLQMAAANPTYFKPRDLSDIIHYLAEIYTQEAGGIKLTPGPDLKDRESLQHAYLEKSVSYTKLWLQGNPHVTQDDELNYADILYTLASATSDGKFDDHLLDESRTEADKAMQMAVPPREQLYQLLAAIAEQKGDLPLTAEYLQVLVKLKPDSKIYWPQLMSVYLNLAESSKDSREKHRYSIRAINAIEGAQAQGLLKDPKSNLNLVAIYNSIGQYGKGTELLAAGLKSGAIESTEKNWEVLASCYQQIGQDRKAIEVYQAAAQAFPETGQFDYEIGTIYTTMGDSHRAYEAFNAAAAKGNLSSGYRVYLYLAFSAFELQKFDEALKACDEAANFPEAKKDHQLARLRAGIEGEIKRQAAAKAAIEGAKI